jgi:hypothetical protein
VGLKSVKAIGKPMKLAVKEDDDRREDPTFDEHRGVLGHGRFVEFDARLRAAVSS